jgi:selenocysteine lyase/cysteine desulfurase
MSQADYLTQKTLLTAKVMASSTTQAFRNLAASFRFPAGSEVILSALDHETNIDAWLALAESQSLVVKWWRGDTSNPTYPKLTPASLQPLLSPKTVLVTFTHCSNILGSIHDVTALAATVHTIPGALCVVDGVAYAPHRRLDVHAWGVDFYAFSWYKVYGPHVSMLYGRTDALKHVHSLGHHFNSQKTLQDKLEVAGASYELVQSVPNVVAYFGGADGLDAAFAEVARHEEAIVAPLLAFLNANEKIVVYGETSPSKDLRVPTVSFSVKGMTSKAVVDAVEKQSRFGFRNGHMFSHRLVTEILGLPEGDGVVRISLVHYNTEEEVKSLIKILESVC